MRLPCAVSLEFATFLQERSDSKRVLRDLWIRKNLADMNGVRRVLASATGKEVAGSDIAFSGRKVNWRADLGSDYRAKG